MIISEIVTVQAVIEHQFERANLKIDHELNLATSDNVTCIMNDSVDKKSFRPH